jgi:hypothetical protein
LYDVVRIYVERREKVWNILYMSPCALQVSGWIWQRWYPLQVDRSLELILCTVACLHPFCLYLRQQYSRQYRRMISYDDVFACIRCICRITLYFVLWLDMGKWSFNLC